MHRFVVASLAAAGLSVGFGAAASAADIAPAPAQAPVYVKAPTPPPTWSWSGIYIGGGVGGMWSQVDGNFTVPPLTSWSTNQSAGILDGHVGLQQQFGSVVLGVEGSYVFAFGNSFGTAACSPAVACTANTLLAERIDNIWTVGPRIGWAIGAWMPYATGGYARATIENQTLSPTPTTLETGDTQNGGWYAGGGVEWNFARNWYTGIEYKHYDFGTVTTVPTFVTGGPDTFNTKSISATADTVSARLSYKFDWGNP